MAAQRAYGEAVVVQLLPEFIERGGVFQHGEFAVRIAWIIARAQLNGSYATGFQLFEDLIQRQLGQESGEYAKSHLVPVVLSAA
jgi:hypothetical protein